MIIDNNNNNNNIIIITAITMKIAPPKILSKEHCPCQKKTVHQLCSKAICFVI